MLELPILWVSIAFNVLFCLLAFRGQGQRSVPLITTEPSEAIRYPIDIANASAVFNVLEAALKERSSNLHPNGVSFIPAYLPANTPMYHSRGDGNIPELFEWVALNYEFSYSFANFPRGTGPRRPPPPHGDPGKHPDGGEPGEGPFKGGPPPRNTNLHFLTFVNPKPLDKLIYLDGASAAKTTTGQMDQQLILSRQEDADARVDERVAAGKICEWGKLFGLQGIIRLEIGFEIILCDFYRDTKLVSNLTLNNVTELVGFPHENKTPQNDLEALRTSLLNEVGEMSGYEHVRMGEATNSREKRLLLDFSKIVTPLNKTWIDPDAYVRRINHIPDELKEAIIGSLESALLSPVQHPFTDWQDVADRFVTKFAPILINLNHTFTAFEHTHNILAAAENMTLYTYNVVRRSSDDEVSDWAAKRQKAYRISVQDYVVHPESLTDAEVLLHSSLYTVHEAVFNVVFDIFELGREILDDLLVEGVEPLQDVEVRTLGARLRQLLSDLRWLDFTRCNRMCKWDEVCYTPTWGPGPMGWGVSGNSSRWFVPNGDGFRITDELQCISHRDIQR